MFTSRQHLPRQGTALATEQRFHMVVYCEIQSLFFRVAKGEVMARKADRENQFVSASPSRSRA